MSLDADEYIRPPGTYYDILPHPTDRDRSVEVAVVQDHRFAFFYWLKWHNRLADTPALISLDWHQDLAPPCDVEREWLRTLDRTNYREIAFFCWDKLHCANDGHVLAAAYLNIIGDIHVVQKQEGPGTEQFEDMEGRTHTICCYNSVGALMEAVTNREYQSLFLDIDLDYFTESSDPNGGGARVDLVPEQEIRSQLAPDGAFLPWAFPRLSGITIATEPEFCGGLINSNNLFAIVNDTLFSPPLLSHRANWKHNA